MMMRRPMLLALATKQDHGNSSSGSITLAGNISRLHFISQFSNDLFIRTQDQESVHIYIKYLRSANSSFRM